MRSLKTVPLIVGISLASLTASPALAAPNHALEYVELSGDCESTQTSVHVGRVDNNEKTTQVWVNFDEYKVTASPQGRTSTCTVTSKVKPMRGWGYKLSVVGTAGKLRIPEGGSIKAKLDYKHGSGGSSSNLGTHEGPLASHRIFQNYNMDTEKLYGCGTPIPELSITSTFTVKDPESAGYYDLSKTESPSVGSSQVYKFIRC